MSTPVRPPEWWAVYGAVWALMRRSGPTETKQLPDRTFVTSVVPRSALAAMCAQEADEAMKAWEEHNNPAPKAVDY